MLLRGCRITAKLICERFEVSRMQAWRDLRRLEEWGERVRVNRRVTWLQNERSA